MEEKDKKIIKCRDNYNEYKSLKREIITLNYEIQIKNDEISIIKKKLMDKEESIKLYKKKYQTILKKNASFENQILDLKENQEIGTITEYESRRKNKKNNLDQEQKKTGFLYKSMTNVSQNKCATENTINSAIQSTCSQLDNNLIITNSNNNFTSSFTFLNNNSHEEDDICFNSNNITNNEIKITPERYTCIKCYQLNNKLKWYLFKKNNKESTLSNLKSYFKKNHRYSLNMKNYNSININNSDISESNINYNDFIWLPYKNESDFIEFGELPKSIDELINEENLIKIEKLEKIIKEKEIKINNINYNYNKNQEKLIENIENLKKENNYLNNIISKYKTEIKYDKNFIGVSFIDDDPECSKFIDDKCCEEILINLEKENSRSINKENKKGCVKNLKIMDSYNLNLKNAIDYLLTQVMPSQNIKIALASILRHLGCSDEDIYNLIGNYKEPINIPFSCSVKK